ncbi:microtubule-associated protein 6 homolog [Salarias fasciatus]|uniref:microtubule-associated protein 6 homolog n=1 Tax=Salarias fasciatus TaxID=181472 RepID=UPI0011764CC6|nr:microtubule-associated protein 6 homolog [Salarias fasciatus]
MDGYILAYFQLSLAEWQWPCITRACCINRFWTELDKGDIAVPLVFTKYSDVADVQHLAHHPQPRAKKAGGIAIETQPLPARTRLRRPARAVPRGQKMALLRPSCAKTSRRGECAPSPVASPGTSTTPPAPFITENPVPEGLQGLADPEEARPPWIPNPAHLHLHGCAPGRSWSPRPPRPTAAWRRARSRRRFRRRSPRTTSEEEREEGQVRGEEGGPRRRRDRWCPQRRARSRRRAERPRTALNRHIKEVMSTSSSYRGDQPGKPATAPPSGRAGEGSPDRHKLQERRRIRSLYSEPGKEPAKVEKPVSRTKQTKKTPTTTTGKMVKKAKEKQISSSQTSQEETPVLLRGPPQNPNRTATVTKKNKEISNRLAEAKQ